MQFSFVQKLFVWKSRCHLTITNTSIDWQSFSILKISLYLWMFMTQKKNYVKFKRTLGLERWCKFKWNKLTCNGRCGGPPILWWYITSCFNCDDICAWLLWCLPISASASALLKIPSFNPEKMSPYNFKYKKKKERKTRTWKKK